MIEQIFILTYKNGMAFTVDYIGVRSQDSHVYKRTEPTAFEHLPAFESLLTEHGFALEDDMLGMRIWARRGEQLALGGGE